LKWLLKAVEQNKTDGTPNHIGKLFESGQGVPLDKNKALEWYCRDNGKTNRDRLNRHGYHLSAADKSKLNYIIDSLY
jgi:TPR repeat protein